MQVCAGKEKVRVPTCLPGLVGIARVRVCTGRCVCVCVWGGVHVLVCLRVYVNDALGWDRYVRRPQWSSDPLRLLGSKG